LKRSQLRTERLRYARCYRNPFNALLQAITWSNSSLTDFSCWGAGFEDAEVLVEFNQPAKQYSEDKTKQLWQHAAKRTKKAG
jgi:hypothetical protein